MRRWLLLWSAMSLAGLSSCEKELPMTRAQIYEAQLAVPTLYRTEAGDEIIAPGNKFGVIVHPDTKQLAWATWQCDNPNCPAKGQGTQGRPYLFIWPNFLAFAKEDGTVAFNQPLSEADLQKFQVFAEPGCPECAKQRDKSKETPEERMQYQNWATKYVLPEAEARSKELDEEMKAHLAREEERKRQAGQN